jgi:NAD+ diphosphatase
LLSLEVNVFGKYSVKYWVYSGIYRFVLPTIGLNVPHSPPLAFAISNLDRSSNQRVNEGWLKGLLENPTTRHVQMHGDKTFVTDEKLQTFDHPHPTENVLLGVDGSGVGWFASRTEVAEGVADLRSLAVAGILPPEQLGMLAQARSVLHWHERHGFCANCGAKTEMRDAGYRRHCATCETDHFPRTDPVIIIAVRHGSRVLLGRQTPWPDGMHSTLAGFMEPGETIEDAARREVFEESGIRVGEIKFHSNQPWPFPSSLMIGLIGEALNDEIVVDTKELETARWFEETEIHAMLEGTHPQGLKAPLPMAIAHHLIRAAISAR